MVSKTFFRNGKIMSDRFFDNPGILPVDAEDPDYLLKIVLIGDSGVGKTSVLSRFARDQYNPESKTTIGVEFATKTIHVDNKVVKAQIWDTAGQERYRAITAAYYRGALGALILYDITSSNSFNALDRWLKELRANTEPNITIMLIGNKCDMKDLRSVTPEEGQNYAREKNLLFVETSAKDSIRVNEAFTQLIEEIVKNTASDNLVDSNNQKSFTAQQKAGVAVKNTSPQEKKGCC